MKQIPDAPWIRYERKQQQRLCENCGYDIGVVAYEIDGELVCEDCFASWVYDYLNTNPEEVARALSVRTACVG